MKHLPVEPLPRLPLVTLVENRGVVQTTDASMVNCFAEKLPSGRVMAVKRSGLSFAYQGTPGCAQGMTAFLDTLYSISGDTLTVNSDFVAGWKQTVLNAGFQARVGAAVVGFSGRLWLMGGTTTTVSGGGSIITNFNDVYSSLDGVSWTQVLANAPWAARGYASAIVFGDKMWIMGGTAFGPASNTTYGDVWWSDNGFDWTLANAAAWPPRHLFGLTTFADQMWVAGGRTATLDEFGNLTGYYSDVWSSSDGLTWRQVTANADWISRSRLGFVGFNNKLWVIGGELPPLWQGAAVDVWSSGDGKSWSRENSNPFSQASSGVFQKAVLSSIGAENWIAPATVTLSGGGGTGAKAIIEAFDQEEEGDDSGGILQVASVINAGSGYTSAPSMTLGVVSGIGSSGYTFLNSLGVVGDKRGTALVSNNTIYFFAMFNDGSPSNEIWQSTDGKSWTIADSNAAYGPRDVSVMSFGQLWVFGGNNNGLYYNDVWSGSFTSATSQAIPVSVPCQMFSFSQTSRTVTSPLLFLKNANEGFIYNPATTLLEAITVGSYPHSTVPGIAYLDGYFVIMDTQGRLWQSAINDPSSWSALGFLSMQAEPNAGVALSKMSNYIVAFGEWSLEFFYDAALPPPGSPFAPNDTLTQLIGCAAGLSLVEMQNTIVWLGQHKNEGRGIYKLTNLQPEKISTPFIDRILQDSPLTSVRAFATQDNGHSLYVITLTVSNKTLVYDFETQLWAFWTSRQPFGSFLIQSLSSDPYGLVTVNAPQHGQNDGDPIVISTVTVQGYNGPCNVRTIDADNFSYKASSPLPQVSGVAQASTTSEGYFIGAASAQVSGIDYILHRTNGMIFKLIPSAVNDFGNPIDMRIMTSSYDGGSRGEKTMSNIDLLADNVQGTAYLRYTNDDYKTYSTYRPLNLSAERVRLTRLGSFRKRAFQLRYTDSTVFRAESLEMIIEDGNE